MHRVTSRARRPLRRLRERQPQLPDIDRANRVQRGLGLERHLEHEALQRLAEPRDLHAVRLRGREPRRDDRRVVAVDVVREQLRELREVLCAELRDQDTGKGYVVVAGVLGCESISLERE